MNIDTLIKDYLKYIGYSKINVIQIKQYSTGLTVKFLHGNDDALCIETLDVWEFMIYLNSKLDNPAYRR